MGFRFCLTNSIKKDAWYVYPERTYTGLTQYTLNNLPLCPQPYLALNIVRTNSLPVTKSPGYAQDITGRALSSVFPLYRSIVWDLNLDKRRSLDLAYVEEYYRIDSDFVVWDTRIQRIMGRGGRNVLKSSTFLFLNLGPPNLDTL